MRGGVRLRLGFRFRNWVRVRVRVRGRDWVRERDRDGDWHWHRYQSRYRCRCRCRCRCRDWAQSGIWRGLGEALLTPMIFVAAGVGTVGALSVSELLVPAQAIPLKTLYHAEMAPGGSERAPHQWLVDGFNVVSVALLRDRSLDAKGGGTPGREGWWRREHREALVERARAFQDPEAEVWVVFDGSDSRGDRLAPPARTVFAPSADDWLLDRVRDSDQPDRLTVVTADRRLANRVRARGARVVSPGDFLQRCGVEAAGSQPGSSCGPEA